MTNAAKRCLALLLCLTLLSGFSPAARGEEAAAPLPAPPTSAPEESQPPLPGAYIPEESLALSEELPMDQEEPEWSLNQGLLELKGSGTVSSAPWSERKGEIRALQVWPGITGLGEGLFYNYPALEVVSLPESLTELGRGCFADCVSLRELSLPGVERIGDYAFQRTALTQFRVPASLGELGHYVFFLSALEEFTVDEANPVFSAVDGVLFRDSGAVLAAYPPASPNTAYSLPDSVKTVAAGAFLNCGLLESLHLNEGLETVESSAFQNCRGLRSIRLPDSLRAKGTYCFYGCTSLLHADLGKGLSESGYGTFEGCAALRDLDLGQLVHLDQYSFAYCESLSELALPGTLREIRQGCFLGCNALERVQIPENVWDVAPGAFPESTEILCLGPGMEPRGSNGFRRLDSVSVPGLRDYEKACQLLRLTNQRRAEQGLGSLEMDQSLLESAMVRAAEIAVYFEHTRPDGEDCFSVNEKIAAENIAAGHSSPSATMDQWMNSEGHRANILSSSFESIGIGCFTVGGVCFWVQSFGRSPAEAGGEMPENVSLSQPISLYPGIAFRLEASPQRLDLSPGEQARIQIYLPNPGWTYVRAPLDGESLNWTSGNPAAVRAENGDILALGGGETWVGASSPMGFFSVSIPVSVSGAEAVSGAVLVGRSLSLEGEIGIHFYLRLPEALLSQPGAAVELSMDGESRLYPLAEAEPRPAGDATLYRFAASVAPKRLHDQVTLRILDGEGQPLPLLHREEDGSLIDCTQGYSSSAADCLEAYLSSSEPSLRALAEAISDYGSCAQALFRYREGERAELFADLSQVRAEELLPYAPELEIQGPEAPAYPGSSLSLRGETAVKHYFRAPEGQAGDYRFLLDGVQLQPRQEGELTLLEISGIKARSLGDSALLRITRGDRAVLTLRYGPLSYAYQVLADESSPEALRQLCAALYRYSLAAGEYFGD